MNTEQITKLCKSLDEHRAYLADLKAKRELLNFSGHQKSMSVSIEGLTIKLTDTDCYYRSKVKRGYEMIHLGAIKAFEAEIDKYESNIKTIEAEIKRLTT